MASKLYVDQLAGSGGSTITLVAGQTFDTSNGTLTIGTAEPTGDTSAGDNAAIGYTAAEGLILAGQGSTNDVTIKNDADAEVMGVLTGTTTAAFAGQVTATGFTGTLDGILGSGTAAAASVTTLTASGIASIDDTTDSTSGTSGSIHTDGGIGAVKDIVTDATFTALGSVASGDSATVGGSATGGLLLIGQGSTRDVTIMNDTGALVLGIPTGTLGVTFAGDISVAGTVEPAGDTAASDAAAIGYTAAEGLILTGQGSTNDITLKNDADAEVCGVPTGTDDLRFPDDAKAEWGTGGDLQIWHAGDHSHIWDSGTGNFYIKTNGAGIELQDTSGKQMGVFTKDGAVTLYHNNSAKIATTSVGATVTGTLIATTDTDATNTGSVTLDFAANQNFVLTFTGNVTLANPTTEQVGQAGVIVCIQDATGSRTLTLGTDYETAGGSGITLSTDANAVDVIPYFVKASGSIQLGAVQKAFS